MFTRTSCLLIAVASFYLASCGNGNPPSDADVCPLESSDASSTSATLHVAGGPLCGTLRLPETPGPHPVALIVAGSGPTDRDGNNAFGIRTDAYAELSDELALRGVASLRYDKRGVGASVSSAESDLRPADEAADVAAWIHQLKRDLRFSDVIVVGHSEGALLATLAMQKESAAAFISLAGPGRRMGQVFRDQLARQVTGVLLDEAYRILDELQAGRTVADVPGALSSVFRPSVQPYLIALLEYEPAAELAKLTVPTLIAQGTTDVQIGVVDARALATARPDAEVLLVEGMCHVLKMAAPDTVDQIAALSDPTRPLAPALVNGVGSFLRQYRRTIPGG
jgi:pimeloyl-ACP methyl ester carboxylesterase